MPPPSNAGPDLVIAGSARSGTSYLASALGSHQDVDPGAVKEPNYFSREWDRQEAWYDGLYLPRRPGLVRLDGSMSYTFKHFPDALDRLSAAAPDARVVYCVRHPLRRLLSHYELHARYFQNEPAETLGAAITFDDVYTGASDYAHWLAELQRRFPPDRLLVVPFPVVTQQRTELLDLICARSGLDPAGFGEDAAGEHQNQVVEFRGGAVKYLRRSVRRSGLYPSVRRALGEDRLRRIRNRATRQVDRLEYGAAIDSCSSEQRERLRTLYADARAAAGTFLREQDTQLGLEWSGMWDQECPPEPWDPTVGSPS